MGQERRHGGGKQGRASVNDAPDSCGIHSLIGVIDTPATSLKLSCPVKKAFLNPYSPPIKDEGQAITKGKGKEEPITVCNNVVSMVNRLLNFAAEIVFKETGRQTY